MLDIRITYSSEYDNMPRDGVLVERLEHNGRDVALIFYPEWVARDVPPYFEDDDGDLVCEPIHVIRYLFRYVHVDNKRLTIYPNEKSVCQGEDKNDLVEKYCKYEPVEEFYFSSLDYIIE